MTTGIRLTCLPHPGTLPLLRGEVSVPGISLVAREAASTQEATASMLALATDAAEMSLATYVQARARGHPLIALPVFPARRPLHAFILCRAQAGIDHPEKLRGRRVGLPQFWMTSSVWHRGILEEFHGVAASQIQWLTTAPERLPIPPTEGVEWRRAPEGSSLETLLRDGEVDCVMLPRAVAWVAKRRESLRPLFSDPAAAERAYRERTGFVPIAHVVAMREALWRDDPGCAEALCAAFARARADAVPREGLAANRRALATFLGYLAAQGGCESAPEVDELFAANVRDWDG